MIYTNSSKEDKEKYSPTNFMRLGQSWFQTMTRVCEGKTEGQPHGYTQM